MFYPLAGGQPGDTGHLLLADGKKLTVTDTRKGPEPGQILHIVAADAGLPPAGTSVTARLDMPRRLRLMRTHTALHLLCQAVGGPVTGGSVGELKGRLDFDLPDAPPDKEAIADKINAWIAANAAVTARWIDDAEFDARPELIRTMSVRPPRGAGKMRLIEIDGIDLQACGGTHVAHTGEIGRVTVTRIEKKGRLNRRIAIEIAD